MIATLTAAVALASFAAIPERDKSGLPHLRSESVVVRLVEDGRELIRKNADVERPIASVTKLVSALVLAESARDILTATRAITIDEVDKDRLKWSRSHIPVGRTFRACDLLNAALSASDNRAICALARSSGLDRPVFVSRMNDKARALGMSRSHFVDPAGLDPANVSTAHDLLHLVAAAADEPRLREAGLMTRVELVDAQGRTLNLGNTNRLMRSATWTVLLGKTGYTIEAGRALVLRVEVAGHLVDMVFLGSREMQSVFGDAGRVRRWLLDTHFKRAATTTATAAGPQAR